MSVISDTNIPDDILHINESETATFLPSLPQPFAVLFERGQLSVELFSPVGVDTQTPHDRDEIYIVSSGYGVFRRGETYVNFSAGDFLFVPAYVDHRFESFSRDFRTWVIFFGPIGGNSIQNRR
ncbi:cupin domain-containing protein [Photorhabdus khanii]|uniref:cupin domain-containing protein n=1 Tax=Photorhabdus khanii TaxID=1004150 RepID=UPI001046D4CB|nr:cupin domain-containing protein [Photorhabdus khanii]